MSGVTVVVPSWNRRDLLARVSEYLRRQTYPIDELIIVDNGSDDGSACLAVEQGARVISIGWNSGFCRAVNAGIREAKGPWVAVVNNDVEPAPDWLSRLMESAQDEDAWFATGKLLSASHRDRVDGAYDTLCRGGCAWRAGHGRPDGPEWGIRRTIRLAPFTAALFRTELFRRVGLLDECFESYLEDVDFGLRCAIKDMKGVYVPEAVAYHTGSATLGAWHKDTVRRIARNQVFLVAKHYSNRQVLRYGWPILVAQLLWGGVALRHRAGLAYLRGKLEALRGLAHVRASLSEPTHDHPESLDRILEESERELLELQRRTGFDVYWRLYFALT